MRYVMIAIISYIEQDWVIFGVLIVMKGNIH